MVEGINDKCAIVGFPYSCELPSIQGSANQIIDIQQTTNNDTYNHPSRSDTGVKE
jgi:hypothetical protein